MKIFKVKNRLCHIKLLQNMKIRTKLIVLLIIMIIGNLLIGMVGLIYNQKSNRALKDMYLDNLVKNEQLSDIRTQYLINYSDTLNLMLTSDESKKMDIKKKLNNQTIQIDKAFLKFKNEAGSKYEKKQVAVLQENLKSWGAAIKEIMGMVSDGESEQAVTKFEWEGEMIFEDIQTSLNNLDHYNVNVADQIYQRNKASGTRAVTLITLVNTIISILCILFGSVITVTISKSIRKVVDLIKKTSNMDFANDSSYDTLLSYKDEIGVIANEIGMLRNVLRNIAENISHISVDLSSSSEKLAVSTEENSSTIRQVVLAVNDIAEGNSSQADMAEKTRTIIDTMASNMEKVNGAAEVSSENVEKSIETIKEGQQALNLTKEKINLNIEMAENVGDAIEQLSNQMDKVGSIVSVIKAISEQTNLLALNASIEAARAGEAGRGFAVVATEIGKLANNTADSVYKIAEIISDAIEKSKETSEHNSKAMKLVQEQKESIDITLEAFNKIRLSVEDIAQRTTKISQSMNDINESSREIFQKASDMADVSQKSAATSEEISASNEEQLASIEMIATAAKNLSDMAITLNQEISKFQF